MTIFDQRGQHVNYQYNASGNINIGAVQNKLELINQLRKLQEEVVIASEQKSLDKDNATDAEYKLKKAVLEAEKMEPDKPTLIEHLSTAEKLVSGVSSLAAAIGQAIEKIVDLF